MLNESKPKGQLIRELSELHQRITQPVASETRLKQAGKELWKARKVSEL